MPERACRSCGCTDVTPCITDGMACHWVGPDLCSACEDLPDPPPIPMGTTTEPSPVTRVVEAKIVDIAMLPGGKIETTISGVLEDGTPFTGVWPGEWKLVDPNAKYSIAPPPEPT